NLLEDGLRVGIKLRVDLLEGRVKLVGNDEHPLDPSAGRGAFPVVIVEIPLTRKKRRPRKTFLRGHGVFVVTVENRHVLANVVDVLWIKGPLSFQPFLVLEEEWRAPDVRSEDQRLAIVGNHRNRI